MKKIKDLLNASGKFDFPLGVELLKEFLPKHALIDYFLSCQENSFNTDLLRAELQKCLEEIPQRQLILEPEITSKQPIQTAVVGSSLTDPKRTQFENLPEELQRLYLTRNEIVRKADILKERIRSTQDKTERYNLGLAVLRHWSEIRTIWGKLDNYNNQVTEPKDNYPSLDALSLIELKALKQKSMVVRSKAKSKGNSQKFNYHDALIRHINERISNVQLR